MSTQICLAASLYRRFIGQLLYLTNTHPNIAYSVQQLSQFIDKPIDAHEVARYIKSSPGIGLHFSSASKAHLKAFSDHDLATCPRKRRSVTSFCVFLGECLTSWKFTKEATGSRSSSEVEYKALASTSCEIQWLHYMLKDFGVTPTTTTFYCDNKSAIYLAHNAVFHERTKHIEIDCHIVRE
ncbi:hypothetical protein L6164_005672 [Bauhinia variegata]|uniref:Uncharacterized protein n=1 Tax=Bauhinia variegata TaxID=167791 RepID=A0ACB9PS07_BAUVA|nr:hypothetical protein L6164_005672 [Bauhinia variegata]